MVRGLGLFREHFKTFGQSFVLIGGAACCNDVFRLAATLPGEPGPVLEEQITTDLARFVEAFPEESGEWRRILNALAMTVGGSLRPTVLREAIATFFRLR